MPSIQPRWLLVGRLTNLDGFYFATVVGVAMVMIGYSGGLITCRCSRAPHCVNGCYTEDCVMLHRCRRTRSGTRMCPFRYTHVSCVCV